MNVKKEKNKITRKVIFIIFLTLFVVSSSMGVFRSYKENLEGNLYNGFKERANYVYSIQNVEPEQVEISERILKLQEFQKINADIVGLIEIEGTNINYPVLQTDNNSYYMTHNYKKEKSKDGSIFLDKDYDFELPSTNLLIYGHNNIGSKKMFAQLMKYKKESFYKKHKIINFTTNEEEAQYEIISVFLSRVYYKHETNVFRYYYFINAHSKEKFNEYVSNCKKASLYEIEADAIYGSQLMTLSTCEYSKKNGRLAVVARKITN